MTKHIQKDDLNPRTVFASVKWYHDVGWKNLEAEHFLFLAFKFWNQFRCWTDDFISLGDFQHPIYKRGPWIKFSLTFFLVPSGMILFQNRILYIFVLSGTGRGKVWWPNHRWNITHKIILHLICMCGQSLHVMVPTYTNSSYHNLVDDADATAVCEILHMQPGKCEDELTDINNESVMRRMKMAQRDTGEHFTLKELLEIFHSI